MEQSQFSRAGKRRFNKRVDSLVSLLKLNEKLFRSEWHKQVQGWLSEVHRRAKNCGEGAEFRNAENVNSSIEQGRTHIFGVLEIAEAMLAACGSNVEKMVGEETRQLLANECIKAVAYICDARLNYMVNHPVYRRAKY
jgi:hypothetical protein